VTEYCAISPPPLYPSVVGLFKKIYILKKSIVKLLPTQLLTIQQHYSCSVIYGHSLSTPAVSGLIWRDLTASQSIINPDGK